MLAEVGWCLAGKRSSMVSDVRSIVLGGTGILDRASATQTSIVASSSGGSPSLSLHITF